jgi:predicted dehydrogenase
MHAVHALPCMQLGKHVYVEKPLTHDIYEARVLTQAEKKYKVVTQMGNQGSSGDDTRNVETWIQAGVIGSVHTVHVWTNRPGLAILVFLCLQGNLIYQKSWTGIFG